MYSDVNTQYAMVPLMSNTVTTTQNVWKNVKFTYTHTNEIITQLGFGQPTGVDVVKTIVVDDVKIYGDTSTGTSSEEKNENAPVLTDGRNMTFDNMTEFVHNKDFIAGGEQIVSAVVVSNEYDHTSKKGKSLKMGDIKISSNRVKVLNMLSDADMGKKFKISVWVLSPNCDTGVRMGIYSTTGTENAFSPVAVTSKAIKKGEWTQIVLPYEYTKQGLNQIGFDQNTKEIAKVLYFDDITVVEDTTIDENAIVGEDAIEISEDTVKFIGRTDKFKDGYPFNWSASGIEFKFTGKNAYVYVSKVSNENQNKYFGVFLDGSKEHKRLKITKKGWYKLFEEDLADKQHTVRFIRSSEGNNADDGIMLKYVKADNVKPTEAKVRKIEFIGDSYTSGYGNLELGGNKKTPENTDGCLSYAYIASQLLDADANIESASGAGATMNNTDSATKSIKNTMPLRIKNSTLVTSTMSETTPWDYSKFIPQIVVVFLGTNDYSGTPVKGSDPEYFKAGYKDFLLELRGYYPNATIIGCSKPSGCYQNEAKEVIESLNDKKIIHFTFTKFDSTGVNKHPYYTTDIEMAEELVAKINSIPGIWN